jgi:hypothetical protein
MRALSTFELIGVWEQGLLRHPVHRALILLAAACPELPLQELAELSLGQRDARLLTLREWAFGSQLVCLAPCPVCGERLELVLEVADVRVPAETEQADPLSLVIADYELQFRLPNSLDLLAVTDDNGAAPVQRQLLERCLLAVKHQGAAGSGDSLPTAVVEAIAAKMGQAGPQADVGLALTCPACRHAWTATFDIGSFFWEEINAWAYRTLHQVHLLASAYGWSEADILSMSPWKRQFYLSLISGS